MKIVYCLLFVAAVVSVVVTLALATTTTIGNAQIIEKDPPVQIPLGDSNASSSSTTTTITTLGERDLSIDLEDEILPANGTVSETTEGITDFDIQSTIPAGITIILDNQSATVTNLPVNIAAAAAEGQEEEEEDSN